jgi:hypothetical protein
MPGHLQLLTASASVDRRNGDKAQLATSMNAILAGCFHLINTELRNY